MPALLFHLPSFSPLTTKPFQNHKTLTLNVPTFLLLLLGPFSTSPKPTADTADGPTRVSLYLRRARLIDALRLRLRSHDPSAPFPIPTSLPIDSFVAAQALRSVPSPDSALCLFRSLQSHPSFSHTHHTLHALAKTLSLSRRVPALRSLLDAVDAGAYTATLPPSPMDRLRWYAAAGDIPSALRAWAAIRTMAADGNRRHPCTESYNLVMGLYAANGMDSDAVETFSKMVGEGANPNSRTYTVIMEHLVGAGKLEAAMEVFDRLASMRIRRTSKQYNVLAEGFMSTGRFDVVRRLISEMQSDAIWPGRAVRVAVARMRESGYYVQETQEFSREMLSPPDERIGYVMGSDGNAAASDDDDDNNGEDHGDDGDETIRLRPWLDPNALASAMGDWDAREVSALEEMKLVWTPRLVCKFLRGFKKPDTAWRFFCWVAHQSGGFDHDRQTVSRMIAILARNGHVELVDRLLSKVKADGILLPFGTVRLVVDFYGLSKRAEAALRLFRDVDSICGALSDFDRRLLCSSLLRTLAKCRRGNEAMELLEEMMLAGVLPDVQTFSGLMQFYAVEGDLRSAHKLFGIMRQCGLEPDGFMYQTLMRAYIKRERAALALRVFEEMMNSNLAPDSATKALLVKSLWNEGKLREAAYVEERSGEVDEGLPVALAGHVWTVSSADLKCMYDIYHGSFVKNNG